MFSTSLSKQTLLYKAILIYMYDVHVHIHTLYALLYSSIALCCVYRVLLCMSTMVVLKTSFTWLEISPWTSPTTSALLGMEQSSGETRWVCVYICAYKAISELPLVLSNSSLFSLSLSLSLNLSISIPIPLSLSTQPVMYMYHNIYRLDWLSVSTVQRCWSTLILLTMLPLVCQSTPMGPASLSMASREDHCSIRMVTPWPLEYLLLVNIITHWVAHPLYMHYLMYCIAGNFRGRKGALIFVEKAFVEY